MNLCRMPSASQAWANTRDRKAEGQLISGEILGGAYARRKDAAGLPVTVERLFERIGDEVRSH